MDRDTVSHDTLVFLASLDRHPIKLNRMLSDPMLIADLKAEGLVRIDGKHNWVVLSDRGRAILEEQNASGSKSSSL
ncbi:hypothetical protein [Pararhizobium haloflavum]|uniref:hypothetical protein n=1 Tax=Pararhizobium haloflavum TaxID=2037914 RepID=UPI0012FFE694|nr:hypothetical protein [Pararhizobium haloflavum]